MEFEGKIALVTGGANGIGKATCFALQREGATTIIVDIDEQAGKLTAKEIGEKGGETLFVQADVSNEKCVEEIAHLTAKKFDGIDILINSAGIGQDGTVVEAAPDEWDKVIATNLRSVYLCSHYMIPIMESRGGGVIVNVGSVQSCSASRRSAAYVASKFGVLGLTKAMAIDHAPRVRVNAVLPGSVDTLLFKKGNTRFGSSQEFIHYHISKCPLTRIARPKEIAEVITFLSSKKASFITGAGIVVDGGLLAKI